MQQLTIDKILKDYQPVSLEKIDSIKLMNRMDTKYIVPTETMMHLLQILPTDYMALEIDAHRFGNYLTTYYDTDDLMMFHAHVTSRYPRFKVRNRAYSQNGSKFLEVKRKKITGRTSKKRLPVICDDNFSDAEKELVTTCSPFNMEMLHPRLINQFKRITLVNNALTERLTFDFDLQFHNLNGDSTPVCKHAAIIEIKQDKRAESTITRLLRNENIRPCGMSKYCVGMLLLNNNLNYKLYKNKFFKFIKTAQWIHNR
jgi:hypothetical protein